MRTVRLPLVAATLALALLAASASPVAAAPADVDLEGRAIQPGEVRNQGSSPAPAPFPAQPVGGYSALLPAGPGSYFAMPDNGYGSKSNSSDFLLRVYTVRPNFLTATGGSGTVSVESFVQLSDPDNRIPFDIVTEGTATRLLTGSDFDIESMRVDAGGNYWFGEEFGPYLLQTDPTGRVLQAPVPLPGVESPESPDLGPGETANLPSSGGFEGMAISSNGLRLYPALEKGLSGEDPRVRRIYEFDIPTSAYTGRSFSYRSDGDSFVIGDFTQLDDNRFLAIERDFLQGPAAAFEKIFMVDLRVVAADGSLQKVEVVDLLDIGDPNGLSAASPEPSKPTQFGIGDPFKFPYVTIESVLPIEGDRLAIVNDNNFSGTSQGRSDNSVREYSDFIVLTVPGLRAQQVGDGPTPVIPEAPVALLLPLTGLGLLAVLVLARRRTASDGPA